MRAQTALESAAQQPVTTTVLRKFAATARKRMRIEGGGYRRDHLRALGPKGRGCRPRGPHHGIEERFAQNARCDFRRKVGDRRRLQFCSGLAGHGR
jgi:hypothetical protein